MKDSPYQNMSSSSFWSTSIANSKANIGDELYKKKWAVTKKSKIATAGSCFAQHIGLQLKRNGFNLLTMEPPPIGLTYSEEKKFGYSLYSARYGNIYTAHQLLQLAKESFGEWKHDDIVWVGENGKFFDALRPGVEPEGVDSAEEVIAHRKFHLARVREMFLSMELFIFTFGLTEAWMHRKSGTIYPTAPGTIAGAYDPLKYKFKNFQFNEVLEAFIEFRNIIHSKQNRANKTKFLLTVSPVPLTATASGDHVLMANTYSKSILRAVAGQLSLYNDIDYFPAYELISNPWSNISHYKKNQRSVKESSVVSVMDVFFKAHLGACPVAKNSAERNHKDMCKHNTESNDSSDDEICEDALLDAFQNSIK